MSLADPLPIPGQAHPLIDYLAASGESVDAFAARTGTTPVLIADVIAGRLAPDLLTARRIITATCGAIDLGDLVAPGSSTLCEGRFGSARPINEPLLAAVIEVVAPTIFTLESQDASLAATAAADIVDALSCVSALSRADRLVEALRPALQENFARFAGRGDPDDAAQQASRLYLAAESRLLA